MNHRRGVEKWEQPVKSYGVCYGVKSGKKNQLQQPPIYLLQGWRHSDGMNFIQACLRNLGTCIQMLREMLNGINPEAKYRCCMQGQTNP